MKVAVIGGGSWGTALARLVAQKGYDVSLWAYEESVLRSIRDTHENKLYLPGIPLPKTLTASDILGEALDSARFVVFAVPSKYAHGVLDQMAPFIKPTVPIISATKGIETTRLCLMSDLIRLVLKRKDADQIAVLSGPSFAREVAQESPTAVTLASTNPRLLLRVQHLFSTPFFRCLLSSDVVGVGLGGALKNVIAIAAGGCDGLGLGVNTQAILMTRGLSEMIDLGVAMGAERHTFYGLSGLGDLFLTCSGKESRNRQVGALIGQGVPLDTILKEMKMVAEGVVATQAAYALSKKYRVSMPIVREVHRILFEGKSPRQAVDDLMRQAYGKEAIEARKERPRKER
jgi:glycerol-3-phosphate dehydrogenase (NAD(P)+)